MDADLPIVRDVLVGDFVRLNADQTVAKAREALAQTGAAYAVVTNARGAAIALATAEALAAVTQPDRALHELPHAPIFVIDAEVLLNEAVSYSAQPLVENPEMAGLVVQADEEVIGVLPRQTLRQHAGQIKTRGGAIDQLAGVTLSRAKYFYCPKYVECGYSKLVIRPKPNRVLKCEIHTDQELIKP